MIQAATEEDNNNIIEKFIDVNVRKENEVNSRLTEFYETYKNSSTFIGPEVTSGAKTAFVDSLIDSLSSCIHNELEWSDKTKFLALQALRILCREPEGCEGVFTSSGISLLMEYAGLKPTGKGKKSEDIIEPTKEFNNIVIESMKCLSNALLQNRQSQEFFDNNNGIKSLLVNLKEVKNNSLQAQFLILRLIFLSTIYQENTSEVMDEYNAIEDLIDLFQPILENISESSKTFSTTILPGEISYSIVISEILKVLFNMMVNERKKDTDIQNSALITVDEDIAKKYERFIPLIVEYFVKSDMPNPPLSPPYTHAIHALMNFPVKGFESKFFPDGDYSIIDVLSNILEVTIKQSNISHSMENDDSVLINGAPADSVLPPLIILMTNLVEDNTEARSKLKERILPSDFDRSKPLNVGESIRACLIRLMTNTLLGNSRETISTLLYTLCDSNANKFVNQVGYGNAIGYLVNHQLMGELNNTVDENAPKDKNINPITGQIESEEKEDPFKNMTDEEKEREAERLFVLFDRLNKTGVIKVMPKPADSDNIVNDLD
jgi:hypothetical protein